MMRSSLALPCVALALLVPSAPAAAPAVAPARDKAGVAFFESKIRPVLIQHCYSCHSAEAKKHRGGLRLDSRAAVLKGGDTGAAINLENREQSLLLRAVGYQEEQLQMPPKNRLDPRDVAILAEWVRRGVPFPEAAATTVSNPPVASTAMRLGLSASRRVTNAAKPSPSRATAKASPLVRTCTSKPSFETSIPT